MEHWQNYNFQEYKPDLLAIKTSLPIWKLVMSNTFD